ncbi:MBL fold metallo-hydrolase [Gulosibacter faecalis]|uniref:MBL fold metallo-hydrolase n=1 Tax=Gulosibacter faecalis TaxID=272240 RepID=A0ABW5UTV1_9MICO|nr:MBL fold metallo-hydrolase [Gulosibacter faecalis]
MSHPFRPNLDAFGAFELHYAEVNDFENNCYVIVDVATGNALIVDAADNAPAIIELVHIATRRAADAGAAPVRVVGVLTTHRHRDHWQALEEIKAHFDVPSYAGANDAAELPGTTEHRLSDGDTIALGEQRLDVIGLRGHTPGSVALALTTPEHPARLITGDSLFPGGIGNTFGDSDAYAQLLGDVVERIFRRFPNETIFYPGHGLPSTLDRERGFLNTWRLQGGLPPENPSGDAYRR